MQREHFLSTETSEATEAATVTTAAGTAITSVTSATIAATTEATTITGKMRAAAIRAEYSSSRSKMNTIKYVILIAVNAVKRFQVFSFAYLPHIFVGNRATDYKVNQN